MSLKTVKRITFSLPRVTVVKLEKNIPKSKRSGFVAGLIEEKFGKKENMTFEKYCRFWDGLAAAHPRKTNKSAADLIREDRESH